MEKPSVPVSILSHFCLTPPTDTGKTILGFGMESVALANELLQRQTGIAASVLALMVTNRPRTMTEKGYMYCAPYSVISTLGRYCLGVCFVAPAVTTDQQGGSQPGNAETTTKASCRVMPLSHQFQPLIGILVRSSD